MAFQSSTKPRSRSWSRLVRNDRKTSSPGCPQGTAGCAPIFKESFLTQPGSNLSNSLRPKSLLNKNLLATVVYKAEPGLATGCSLCVVTHVLAHTINLRALLFYINAVLPSQFSDSSSSPRQDIKHNRPQPSHRTQNVLLRNRRKYPLALDH